MFLLLCLSLLPCPVNAAASGCTDAAEEWIATLADNPGNTDIYRRHARFNCEFSGRWMHESRDLTEPSRRERLCQDLVLLWTHKKCNYFRDDINPDAYLPCESWVREMHRRCMANDADWFPRSVDAKPPEQ